jgi:hypothetical protein
MKEVEAQMPVFPVAGWETGQSVSSGCVLLRVLYLANAADNPAQPYTALLHSLTPMQARTLAVDLLDGAEKALRGVGC